MTKIAVIGIAGESVFLTVDKIGKTGETTISNSLHKELGGKGFNQAIACARCGAKVSFLGATCASNVESFSLIAKEKGIDAHFKAKEEPSPYAVIVTDKKGDNKVIVYHGATLSVKDAEDFSSQIESADILLINNETPIEVNKKAVEIAKAKGVKVILNPAPKREYDKEFLDKIDLFTPNEFELDGLEDYKNVVQTLGDKGVLIKKTGKLIPAKSVQKVVDTTGAGDTFNGVLAVYLAEGQSLEYACEKANIASAIKVQRKYILDTIPSKEEIEEYKEK